MMCFYVWMTRKTQVSYESVLERLEYLAGDKLAVQNIVTDQGKGDKLAFSYSYFMTKMIHELIYPKQNLLNVMLSKNGLVAMQSIDVDFITGARTVTSNKCPFRIDNLFFSFSKNVRTLFHEKLKSNLVPRRQKATEHDNIIVNHCYKACRILCYLPNEFALNYCDFLIESANCILDTWIEVELKEKIKSIRDGLVRDPKVSWYAALIETGSWVDTTSNKFCFHNNLARI